MNSSLSPNNALRWGYSKRCFGSMHACVRRYISPCEHDRDKTIKYPFIKLGRHVHYDERMNPIDFGGQMSRLQLIYMEIGL